MRISSQKRRRDPVRDRVPIDRRAQFRTDCSSLGVKPSAEAAGFPSDGEAYRGLEQHSVCREPRALSWQFCKLEMPTAAPTAFLGELVLAGEYGGNVEIRAVRLEGRLRASDEFCRCSPSESVADEHPQRVGDVIARIAPVHVVEVD